MRPIDSVFLHAAFARQNYYIEGLRMLNVGKNSSEKIFGNVPDHHLLLILNLSDEEIKEWIQLQPQSTEYIRNLLQMPFPFNFIEKIIKICAKEILPLEENNAKLSTVLYEGMVLFTKVSFLTPACTRCCSPFLHECFRSHT